MFKKILSIAVVSSFLFAGNAAAQSEIYPQHFNLEEVTLLDGQNAADKFRSILTSKK